MNFIDIDLKNNICSDEYVIGYQGESYVNGIHFILPDELANWNAFIDLENANGDKTRYEIVDIDNNVITYEFTAVDLKYRGKLILNLVLVKDKQILKPYIGEFVVNEAICAENGSSENVPIILSSNLSNEIYKNIKSRHEHSNIDVLNKLEESNNGNLIYNGNPIIGGSVSEECDPTVPEWAKQEEKPTYSADEISGFDEKSKELINNSLQEAKELGLFDDVYIGSGEMPDGYNMQIDPTDSPSIIPTKTSQLENDSGFVTEGDLPTRTSQFENDSGFITSDDLPEPELPTVTIDDIGKMLKVISVNEDGTFICKWADGSVVDDVQINNESIVTDGVANIPVTTNISYNENPRLGVVGVQADTYGINITSNGLLHIKSSSIEVVNQRNSWSWRFYNALTLDKIDYAVKAAMCDGKGTAWTEEEQAAARKRIGCADLSDIENIITITMDADTLIYEFPSLADYKILYFIISKIYKATTGLSGNCWFRFGTSTSGFYNMFAEARTEIFLDASMPTGITGMVTASNNVQTPNYWKGIYAANSELDASFRGSPTYTLANADIAAYHAECGTTIRVMGVRR